MVVDHKEHNLANAERTHFGFQDVAREEKTGLVRTVFDSVAPRYDLMNDLMSGGAHRLWKAALIDWLRPTAQMHLLDVAGGTGDVAFGFRKAGGAKVTICDINEQMVSHGRDRAVDRGLLQGIDWCVGDAEHLPMPDRSVDAYTIAFGLRNVTDPQNALFEACRVLKPGGRFLCLEFSHVVLPWLAQLYDRYSFSVLPQLGHWIGKDREAYQYLAESIRKFPPQEELASMMQNSGLELVSWRNLTGGVVAIHSGWRL
jgi:demethylmenaquinone methyltransferase / 2-methoxy-6-polyprenyl-1,4-benzoquinol methylase